MSETLLEKAKKVNTLIKSKDISDELVELALAWLRDEVSIAQLS